MAISPELIREAQAGDRFKLHELAEQLTPQNYTLPILRDAILTHFQPPTLHDPGHTPMTHTSTRIFLTAVGAMASLDYVCEVVSQLHPSSEGVRRQRRREGTVELLLQHSTRIFDWFSCIFQRTPGFTPFVYETGGMTVNNVCATLNAIMQLDTRLANAAVDSASAAFIAMRLWTLRTPPSTLQGGEGRTRLMIPPGSTALELYATFAMHEKGGRMLEKGLNAAPFVLDKFAEAFMERLDILDRSLALPRRTDPIPTSEEVISHDECAIHLNICFVVLRVLSKNSARVHAALWRRNYIMRWCGAVKALVASSLNNIPNALRLCAQVLQICTECNGDTISAVQDYVHSGLLLSSLQLMSSSLPRIEGLALQALSAIFYRLNKYCYRSRTARAVDGVVKAHQSLVDRLVGGGGGGMSRMSGVGVLLQQMANSARLFRFWMRTCRESASTVVCDNASHWTAAGGGGGRGVEERYPQMCSGCHMVVYCGRECQFQDWKKRHRGECKPMRKVYLSRSKSLRKYHYTDRETQLQVSNTLTAAYSLPDLHLHLTAHNAPYITIFDTTKDPPDRYIYKLDLGVYEARRMKGDCTSLEERVEGVLREFEGRCGRMMRRWKEREEKKSAAALESGESEDEEDDEEEGDVWLVDAGFTNGCDEMVSLLMMVQKIKGMWRIVESVPRILPNARYGLFPDCERIMLQAVAP